MRLVLRWRGCIPQPAGAGGGDSLRLGGIGPRGVLSDKRPASRVFRISPKLVASESAVRPLHDLDGPVGGGVVQGRYHTGGHRGPHPFTTNSFPGYADSASGSSISVESAPPITVSFKPGAALAMFSAKKRAIAIGC